MANLGTFVTVPNYLRVATTLSVLLKRVTCAHSNGTLSILSNNLRVATLRNWAQLCNNI